MENATQPDHGVTQQIPRAARQPQPEAKGARHVGPPLLLLAASHTALFMASLIGGTLLAGGTHFPSPFQPAAESAAYFAAHAELVRIGAFLQLGSAIPLGLFGVTCQSRLHFLGVDVAGTAIAGLGATGAALMLMLSALSQWTLAMAQLPGQSDVLRALHLLAFGAGGPGFAVMFGLLVAGVSLAGGLTRRLPRALMWLGLAVALTAELSSLSLVYAPLAYLLPLARFPGLAWLLGVSLTLPRFRKAVPQELALTGVRS